MNAAQVEKLNDVLPALVLSLLDELKVKLQSILCLTWEFLADDKLVDTVGTEMAFLLQDIQSAEEKVLEKGRMYVATEDIKSKLQLQSLVASHIGPTFRALCEHTVQHPHVVANVVGTCDLEAKQSTKYAFEAHIFDIITSILRFCRTSRAWIHHTHEQCLKEVTAELGIFARQKMLQKLSLAAEEEARKKKEAKATGKLSLPSGLNLQGGTDSATALVEDAQSSALEGARKEGAAFAEKVLSQSLTKTQEDESAKAFAASVFGTIDQDVLDYVHSRQQVIIDRINVLKEEQATLQDVLDRGRTLIEDMKLELKRVRDLTKAKAKYLNEQQELLNEELGGRVSADSRRLRGVLDEDDSILRAKEAVTSKETGRLGRMLVSLQEQTMLIIGDYDKDVSNLHAKVLAEEDALADEEARRMNMEVQAQACYDEIQAMEDAEEARKMEHQRHREHLVYCADKIKRFWKCFVARRTGRRERQKKITIVQESILHSKDKKKIKNCIWLQEAYLKFQQLGKDRDAMLLEKLRTAPKKKKALLKKQAKYLDFLSRYKLFLEADAFPMVATADVKYKTSKKKKLNAKAGDQFLLLLDKAGVDRRVRLKKDDEQASFAAMLFQEAIESQLFSEGFYPALSIRLEKIGFIQLDGFVMIDADDTPPDGVVIPPAKKGGGKDGDSSDTTALAGKDAALVEDHSGGDDHEEKQTESGEEEEEEGKSN